MSLLWKREVNRDKKMTKTCKNCRHEGKWLNNIRIWIHINPEEHGETCPCKKFEAVHSPLDDQKGDVKGLPNISEKVMKGFMSSMEDVKKGNYIIVEKGKPQKQKGCGKEFRKGGFRDSGFICGEVGGKTGILLCPSCSGNHTRQTKPKKRGDNNQTPATSFSDGDTGQPAEKEPDRATTLSGSDFDLSDISRGTKCFGAWSFKGKDNKHYFGAFPNGFLNWLKKQGWYYGRVCHICSGTLVDSGSYRVDIRPEVKPDLVADGRKDTGIIDETFDVVIIDPPYSLELSKNYGTEKFFGGIDSFTKEAFRIVKNNGLVVTLSYQIPKRIKGCGFIAVWGIYTIPSTSYMRCLTVSKKRAGEKLR